MYSTNSYKLTEGMERYSAMTDVNALALSISDTRPANIPPVQHAYIHEYICK